MPISFQEVPGLAQCARSRRTGTCSTGVETPAEASSTVAIQTPASSTHSERAVDLINELGVIGYVLGLRSFCPNQGLDVDLN